MKKLIAMAAVGVALVSAAFAQNGAIVRVNHLAEEVSAPRVLTVSNGVVNVFSNNASRTDGRTIVRTIQNTGTNALFYCIGNTNVTATNYHGILAAGSAMRDGLGSIGSFHATSTPIYIRSVTNWTEVAVVELTQ
jgi:Zn-dependent alcohol dehydrogenase